MDNTINLDNYAWTIEELCLAALPSASQLIRDACNELADQIASNRESDYWLEQRVLRAIYSRRNLVQKLASYQS